MKTYESLDGITIRVGTNAKENYELTESSHAANWWLHVKGWPGSHVVVSYDGDFLPKETKKDAAALAVHYSQASGQKHVTVDLIRVQHVHPLNTHGSVELSKDPIEVSVFINREKPRLNRLEKVVSSVHINPK